MKATEVKTGQTYKVKVGQNSTEVKITRVNPKGGWEGVNVSTGKAMNVKSAGRIIGPSNGCEPDAKNKDKAGKSTASAKQSNTGEPVATVAKPDAKPLSLLNAAEIVLQAADRPLSCKEIIEKAVDAGVWEPGAGKTPANTLYSSILREIARKGADTRFKKTGRGKFVFNG